MGRILLALLIDAVILAYPAYLGLQYRKLPPIRDITTDPIDPPRFEALARLRAARRRQSGRLCRPLFRRSSSAWPIPDIETARARASPLQRAYEVTLALVTKRKWRVVDERPPQPAPR